MPSEVHNHRVTGDWSARDDVGLGETFTPHPCPADCPARAAVAPPTASETAEAHRELDRLERAEDGRRGAIAAELEAWWLERVQAEIEGVVPKAVEYSATDLADLGRQIAEMAGWPVEKQNDHALTTELGIAFYVAGKVGRVMGAIKEGRLPSDDTWHDIAVYTKMAQRTRAVGSWPGTKEI